MPKIRKVLIANRAEIASRIMRSARPLGIATVAVFSDADAGLPYVDEADEAVRLEGNEPADTYLHIERLVDAARRAGADAVHPGYGFLSERADFARACVDAGLTFVGPSAEVIDLMGSKIEAKATMSAAGVPVLPMVVVDDAIAQEDVAAAVEQIGLPIIVKAALGGGGRGMRIVHDAGALAAAVGEAQREAASAFGSGQVFLERYIEAPRHIEVQILGDSHGTVCSLFERECSIQRRHQKVIEESPSPIVDDALRDELCSAAVAAAKAIGYVNAGTVEFVVDREGGFWFLEVNTRLQVEHPVTELITGLDLVELQFRVAEGESLPVAALDAAVSGHAIEARLYAEDVAAGFLPVAGRVERLRIPVDEHVRVDAGYADGSVVSTYYDAMLAKVIAWAPDRAQAAGRLADALGRAEIHGPATNRDLLVGTLRHPEFLSGQTDTAFFERNEPQALENSVTAADAHRVHAIAAAFAVLRAERSLSPLPAGIAANWRNVGPAQQAISFTTGSFEFTLDATAVAQACVHDGDTVTVDDGGIRRPCSVHIVASTVFVDSALGHSSLHLEPRFPSPDLAAPSGSLLAPLPGVVHRVLVGPGEEVEAGQPLLVLEAMKMEHTIKAPADAVVERVLVKVGSQVEGGAVLLVLDGRDEEART